MINYNRVELKLIPVGGVDSDITCNKCTSACCREGTVMPLDENEAGSLIDAGTKLEKMEISRKERRQKRLGKAVYYRLNTDCGNLDGLSCAVFGQESPARPNICGEFSAGSFSCGLAQNRRVNMGEDAFVNAQDELSLL